VINCLLLWALPDSWTRFELLAPDVGERVEAEMRRRFEGAEVDEADLGRVIQLQVESLREFAADGVIMLATHAQGKSSAAMPPPGLSLTLALANRPDAQRSEGEAGGGARSPGAAAFVSEATPLILDDIEMSAFTKESRVAVTVPGVGTPFNRFQVQAFVLPNDQAGMAVITLTTFDPDSENDARETARLFANTLTFVTADEADTDISGRAATPEDKR
jgi:hypothetical protein